MNKSKDIELFISGEIGYVSGVNFIESSSLEKIAALKKIKKKAKPKPYYQVDKHGKPLRY